MTDEISAKNRNAYVLQLTSLRGIACMVVLAGHVVQVVNYHYTSTGIVAFFRRAVTGAVNAEGAVLVFFVLSGCVLALSLKNLTGFESHIVGGFYVKRVFRLYPLLWLSLIFAVFSMWVAKDFANAGIFSDWLRGNILTRVSLSHSLLSLTGMYTAYNGPMWSLRVERVYSFLFPAIYLAMRQQSYRKWTLILLALFALIPVPQHFGTGFAISFAAGACIPLLPARPPLNPAILLLTLIVIMYDRLALAGFNPPEHVFDLIETAAAFFIVRDIYAAGPRYRALLSRPIVLLGELSFSIYLLHLPVFLVLFVIIAHYAGLAVLLNHPAATQLSLCIATTAVTVVIAIFTYRFVELPMHEIGRRLGRQLVGRSQQRSQLAPMPVHKAPSA
jgi:peptidoglycan/LPS O-acetylase OafA/YrhL